MFIVTVALFTVLFLLVTLSLLNVVYEPVCLSIHILAYLLIIFGLGLVFDWDAVAPGFFAYLLLVVGLSAYFTLAGNSASLLLNWQDLVGYRWNEFVPHFLWWLAGFGTWFGVCIIAFAVLLVIAFPLLMLFGLLGLS